MKRLAALATMIALLGSALTPAPEVINVMPSFWRVWDSSTGEPLGVRVDLFRTLVLKPNVRIYADQEFTNDLSDSGIAGYLQSMRTRAPLVRALGERLTRGLPDYFSAFLRAFPDFRTGGVTIYVLPSFWHFNGAIREVGSKPAILLGPDGIAAFDGPRVNLGVAVVHELFHVYQIQLHPQSTLTMPTLGEAVWGEGLAAYVSQRVISGATRAEALGRELAALDDRSTRKLACALAPHLGEPLTDELNTEYFDSGEHPMGLPARGAYLIGYSVAKRLNARRDLRDLALLQGIPLRNAITGNVRALCTSGNRRR